MPTRSTITLTDRQTTPVAHAYAPAGEGSTGLTIFREPGIVFAADSILSFGLRGLNGTGKVRPFVRLFKPIYQTEVVNGISSPKLIDTLSVDAAFAFGRTTSQSDRDNFMGEFYSLMAPGQTAVRDFFRKCEPFYGG